jgi:hypothetical protein
MKQYSFLFCIGLLLLLSGCGQFIEWGKQTLYQGESLSIDLASAQRYIRSVYCYDQFTLMTNFDVLWLSAPVRDLYTNVSVRSLGKNAKQKELLAIRVKEELKHYITFYVISPYNIVLDTPQSLWSLLLEIDTVLYHPAGIKTVELEPIYLAIFEKRVMRFCNSYQVKFDAINPENLPIISEQTKDISLLFRSIDKELRVSWKLS